jgi:nucleoside-diphosphate-sugar epimerase
MDTRCGERRAESREGRAESRERRAKRKEGRAVLPSGVKGAMIGNIGPETDWSDALSGIEGIVHLAARVHVMRESAADPLAAFREVNVEGTKCLAIAATNTGVKRFVYISSVKVNGEGTRDESRSQGSRVSGQEKIGDRGQGSEVDPQITRITRIRKKGIEDRRQRSEVRKVS